MGAFRNNWSTSFNVLKKSSLTLADLVDEVKRKVPEVKHMSASRLLPHITILGESKGRKCIIVGYNSSPITNR